MNITLYKFAKETASTKRPGDSTPKIEKDVKLLEDTSTQNPSFILSADNIDTSYNYIKWNDYYYYISEYILRHNNIYEIRCKKDVLASWRGTILNSSQYVLRSASESDGLIVDNLYPTRASIDSKSALSSTTIFNASVKYVVGMIAKQQGLNNTVGAIQYYSFTQSQMMAFIGFLMNVDNATYFNIPAEALDISLQKALFNPLQYVVSCMAVPSNIYLGEGAEQDVNFGWNYTLPGIKAKPLDVNFITLASSIIEFDINIDKHPQADARGDYLNLNPYSQYVLRLDPFGEIPLDSLKLRDVATVHGVIRYDIITGDGTLFLEGKTAGTTRSQNIAYSRARIGIPIQLSQIADNYVAQQKAQISLFSSSVSAIASGASLNPAGIASGLANVAGSIVDAHASQFPLMEKSGANGSMIILGRKAVIYEQFTMIVDEDNDHYGRPLCKVRTLSSLSGFTLCRDAEISIAGSDQDAEMIKAYLNSGVIIE